MNDILAEIMQTRNTIRNCTFLLEDQHSRETYAAMQARFAEIKAHAAERLTQLEARAAHVTAYQTEHGMQAICPTTQQTYLSSAIRLSADKRYVSMACACCDAELRTGDACDPTEPQWHIYLYAGLA